MNIGFKLWFKNSLLIFSAKKNINTIKSGMRDIEAHTEGCINFIPRTNESDYIMIHSRSSGCSSMVGRQGGQQKVALNVKKCLDIPQGKGQVIHQLLHVLGFFDEHYRRDRDKHVDIIYKNIFDGKGTNKW